MRLEALIAAGEAMLEELGREYYLTGAGLKREPAFQAIYDRYDALLHDDALRSARESGSRALMEWMVDVRVGRLVAPLEEQQLVWEQQATVRVNGSEIPYLRTPIELANAPDRGFRLSLDRARAHLAVEGLRRLRRDRFRCEREAVERLELGTYVEALSTLSGIDLAALGRGAEALLEDTEDMYLDVLERVARHRLGLPLSSLERADAVWLFRANQFDHAFPASGLLETARAQMRELGLDAEQGGRVRFDTDEREHKQPRAFCVPVRVPDEVYLVLRPRGGHNDYRTFWHELGHALHFASVDAGLSFEARRLGDNSVTEGFAMLMDHCTLDPAWLHRYAKLSPGEARDLAFELAVHELFMVRRYAAKLRYELEFHGGGIEGMDARYAQLLSDATRFRYLPDDYLVDLDPGFYAARYLRAWQLEAVLVGVLVERHDEDWYRNPAAGAALQALMRRGQRDPADRIAADVTGAALNFAPLVRRLHRALA